MKKLLVLTTALFLMIGSFAQSTQTTADKNAAINKSLADRAADHLMIQFSSDHWSGAPDSISSKLKSLSRGANVYIMLDKPFKSNPKLSVGFGVGISTSSMYFNNEQVTISSTVTKLPFVNTDSSIHYKKYKLSVAYLEVPIELRFTQKPLESKKSLKFAIGAKIGTLLNVHTKGKDVQAKDNTSINATLIEKEYSKHYFNATRLSLTARVGLGNFSLFGSYAVSNMLKDGVGPDIKPYQIGLTISGL